MATFHEVWPDRSMGVYKMPDVGVPYRVSEGATEDQQLPVLALKSDLVALERVHRLLEQGRVLARVARDVELFKLDGDIEVLRGSVRCRKTMLLHVPATPQPTSKTSSTL